MEELKVKVTDDGKIIINIYDLIAALSEEEREEIATHFAYQSKMFEEIKHCILDEYSGPDWNEEIHKIRVAFLTGEDADERVAAVVRQLLTHLKQTKKQLDAWEKVYWKFYHAWNDYYRNAGYGLRPEFPIEKPEHVSLEFPSDKEVEEYISGQAENITTTDTE
jgi:hypothetical protein